MSKTTYPPDMLPSPDEPGQADVIVCARDGDAEIERLRADKLHWEHQNGLLEAEIERLQAALEDERKAHQVCVEMRNDAEKQIERLRALLRAALPFVNDVAEGKMRQFNTIDETT